VIENIRFPQLDCAEVCKFYTSIDACVVAMASDWSELIDSIGYSSVEVTSSCTLESIIVSLGGPYREVNDAVVFLTTGCFSLSNFGMTCGPGNVELNSNLLFLLL